MGRSILKHLSQDEPMNTSTSALGHERPGAHLQVGGYADTAVSHGSFANIAGTRSPIPIIILIALFT